MAFPLLKKLTELGDFTAKKRFKEEIGIRYFNGVKSVRTYLEEEGYLEYLSRDEIKSFINSGVDILDELEGILGKELRISTLKSIFVPVVVRNGEIVQLRIGNLDLKSIPECIQNLRYLELLDVSSNLLEELPSWIRKLKSLKCLEIYGNKIPKTIIIACLFVICFILFAFVNCLFLNN